MNSLDGFRVLCGLPEPLLAADAHALPPFAPEVTDFLADLSAALMKDKAAREYPEIAAFAFFCRRANLQAMQANYDDLDCRIGRGLAFHIAPGNVPMNFAYSLVAALLAGNASIVKAPSKSFAQVGIACTAMQTLLNGKHQALKSYINVIEYPRERQDLTEAFSKRCDTRIIWGGDETIRRVRQAELKPRAFDITFADRWSLAVLDTAGILRMKERELAELAKGFYNDTYLYDQNACTSPRLCVWLGDGDALREAKARFWNAVHAQAATRYPLDPVAAVDKLTELYRAAVLLDGVLREATDDNLLTRIHIQTLSPGIMDIHCTGGCFLEYDAENLTELKPVLTEKTQTIACAGIEPEAVRALVQYAGVKGADRAVPVGHTMDFSLVWDGYDLIRCLSRMIS
ncbi:MAG: acyl-CoA reductase [Bacillota bacterium]